MANAEMSPFFGSTSSYHIPSPSYQDKPSQFVMAGLSKNLGYSQRAAKQFAQQQEQMMTCGLASGRGHSPPMMSAQASNTYRLAAQAQFLGSMGVYAPTVAYMAPVGSMDYMPKSIEETMTLDAKDSDAMLTTAFGEADLTLLNATRLSSVLPYTTFMSPQEQLQQKLLFRAAYEAAADCPDMAPLYLSTISASVPNLAQYTKSKSAVYNSLLDGQVLYRGTNIKISYFLQPPQVAAQVGSCTAALPTGSFYSKDAYVASKMGQDVFSPSYGLPFAASGLTNNVRAATMLGQELLQ